MDWFYAIGSEQLGPVSSDRLNAMLAAGEVTHETLVWHDEMTEWQALGDVMHMLNAGGAVVSTDDDYEAMATMPVPAETAEVDSSFDWGPCEVGNICSRAYALFKRNMGSLVICFFVMLVLSIVVGGVTEAVNYYAGRKVGVLILTQVGSGWVSMCLTLGMIKYFLDVADHGEGSLGSLFAYPLPAVLFLLAGYLMGIVAVIGLFLLIIPGLYIMARCYLFTAFGVDKGINGFEALGQCWERSGPYVLTLFLMAIVQGLVAFSGLLLLGVGFLLTGPLAICMSVVAYRTIQPLNAHR